MLAIKEAVNAAVESFKDLYGPSKHKDVSLEEVEMSDDDRYWLVTLGYSEPLPDLEPSDLGSAVTKKLLGLGSRFNRKYKVFKIDSVSGTLRSMKDWSP